MTDHANMLRQAAAEMRHYGHDGWPNVCDWGADELDRLNAQALELCAEISGLRRENESMRHDLGVLRGHHHEGCMAEIERLRGLLRDVIADDEASLARGDYGIANGLRLSIDAALAGTADQPSAALIEATALLDSCNAEGTADWEERAEDWVKQYGVTDPTGDVP